MSNAVYKLPKLTEENIHSIMAERLAAIKNEESVIPMYWQGLLELDIPGMDGRTAKLYVPKNCRQTANFVLMNTPAGEDTIDFLHKSGWIQAADANKLCLFVLEPGEGGWKSPAEEMPYMKAGHMALRVGQHLLAGFSDFSVGYGPVGSCLQRIAMENALRTTAAVYIDACNIPEEEVCSFQNTPYTEPNLFGPKREYDFNNGFLPVPVWIISKEITGQERVMADYWKAAAKAGDMSWDDTLGCVYTQNEDSIFTPEGHIMKVAVKEAKVDYTAEETTEQIVDFLLRYYRYGQGACSNMIANRLDYKKVGIEYRSFTDSNGFARQYLVYIPEAYRDGKKKLPVVVNFHGAQQSMEDMIANGQWYHVADEKGLMIVCAECVLDRPKHKMPQRGVNAYALHWKLNDDETPDRMFVNDLLNQLIDNYPVDEKRIYTDGHSMGCMMSNYLASGPVAKRFAAFSGTSGSFLTAKDHDVGGVGSPMWISYGEYDMFGHADLSEESQLTDTLKFWLERNGLGSLESPDDAWVDGRYHHMVWKNEKGVPVLHYNWVGKKAHTHTPEENRMFWDNWLSKWALDDEGNRLYEGKRVD